MPTRESVGYIEEREDAQRSVIAVREDILHPSMLEVRVSDELGVQVQGAVVSLYLGVHIEASSETDNRGRALLDWPEELVERVITVTADGFADASVELFAATPVTVDIELAAGGAIEGTVKMVDGLPANEEVIVLASSSPEFKPLTSRFSPAELARHSISHAVAGPDGRFTINGLRMDSAYSLYAVGKSVISWPAGTIKYYLCGEQDAEVVVAPLWGISVDFVSSLGEDIPTDILSSGRSQSRHLPGITPVSRTAEAYILSREFNESEADQRHDKDFLFAQTGQSRGTPTVALSYSVPGLGTASLEDIPLGRRGPSGFPSVEIQFEQPLPRWGIVRLGVDPEFFSEGSIWLPRGTLELRSIASGRTDQFPIKGTASNPEGCGVHVAVGSYECRFVSYMNRLECELVPAGELVVGEKEVCELLIRVPDEYGFIEMNVVRPDNGRVSGVGATVTLNHPDSDEIGKWMMPAFFSGESYLVGPLSPAKYTAEVVLPFRTSEGPRKVEVKSGSVSSEWFVLTR